MEDEVHAAVHDVIKEFPVLGVFHDDEDPVVGFDDLVELGYRRVADQFEDVQLSRDALNIGYILDFVLLQDLDGHGLAGVPVDGLFDLAKSALADGLPAYPHAYSIK